MILIIILILIIPAAIFPSTIEITNEYIKIIADVNTGRFIIRTTGGNKNLDTDQNALLLYDSDPPNSFTTIRIDNKDYIYGNKEGKFTKDVIKIGQNILCSWKVKDIIITQKLRFIIEPTTGNKDSVEISYRIQNNDSRSHWIGIRIMLDTYLGEEDGAPFRIPGIGPVVTERSFEYENIPQYWYSYDDLIRPTVQAQGTLKIKKRRPPDKVIFANCWRLMENKWDFEIEKGRNFKRSPIDARDNAVAIFWNPKIIKPENSFIVKTYYGLYGATIHKGKVFNVALSSPVKISSEPFIINTDMQNISPFNVDNVTAKIMLPKGLKLYKNDTAEKNIGSLSPKEMIRASWNVIPDETITDEVNYKVKISAKVKEEKTYVVPEEIIPERKIIIIEKEEIVEDKYEDVFDMASLDESKIEGPVEMDIIEDITLEEEKPVEKIIYITNIINITNKILLKKELIKTNIIDKTNVVFLEKEMIKTNIIEEITYKTNIIDKTEVIEKKTLDVIKIDDSAVKEFDNILFKFDGDMLTDIAKVALDKAGEIIKKYEVHNIIIKGYTDRVGYKTYNLRLSERRAASAASYLIEKGYITEQQVIIKGYGKKYPIAGNSTEGTRQKNRRVEIILIGKKK